MIVIKPNSKVQDDIKTYLQNTTQSQKRYNWQWVCVHGNITHHTKLKCYVYVRELTCGVLLRRCVRERRRIGERGWVVLCISLRALWSNKLILLLMFGDIEWLGVIRFWRDKLLLDVFNSWVKYRPRNEHIYWALCNGC